MATIIDKLSIFLIKWVASWSLTRMQRVGALLGKFMFHLHLEPRHVTQVNLNICFPYMPEREKNGLVKMSLQNTGAVFLESAGIWHWPLDKSLDLVVDVEGEHFLQQAQAEGRGVLFLGPHLGNWELTGLYLSTRFKMASLYRPPKQPALEAFISHARGRAGAELVPTTTKGVARLLGILRKGGVVGILPDQVPPDNSSEIASFFDHPAKTMTLVSRLVEKTSPVVLCAFAIRLPQAAGFKLIIQPAHDDIYSQDLTTSVTGLNKSVEDCVRRAPEQYQWEYKRFKGERPGFPRPY
ncbi:MAG: lysophospholipid acyltransferase family protein [Hahellaceae bacterium]|nr:lysophospholipid acyltransferase family protein [Hahellaceae bacterium]MCP5168648.1 lysophospholipid acyltransferase family protein [Hahellaceae bacterium]